MTVKAKDIEQAICNHFWRGMLWFPQLRVGTGFGHDAERTMDLFGIQPLSPWDRICVEIKVSRGDFRRDIRQPMKQRRARLLANQFFYAAPKGLLTAEDLPTWAGLIEVDADSSKSLFPPRDSIRRPRRGGSWPSSREWQPSKERTVRREQVKTYTWAVGSSRAVPQHSCRSHG
jgi:hypothetical protein